MTEFDDVSSEKLIVCSILSDGTASACASINAVTDAAHEFARWRREWDGPFLPVAILKTDPALFEKVTSWSLPAVKPLSHAAFIFGRVGVDRDGRAALFRHLHLMGPGVAGLLVEWAKAVLDV